MKTSLPGAEWEKTRIKNEEIEKYLDQGTDFIPESEIFQKLYNGLVPDLKKLRDILDKSLAVETLTPGETAALLAVEDPEHLALMKETALTVKKKVYDNRIVTFAPLYLANRCINNCLYCGFRQSNSNIRRVVLDLDAVRKETEVLAGNIGHKRLIVVYGEHPESDITYMVDSIRTIYGVTCKTKNGNGAIRRVNVNASPLSIEELKQLKNVGIGTYQVFQETYHRNTYRQVHPTGTLKGNYRWRLYSMHRAMEAGVDDVGLGVLFGLYDWKFDVMGLIYHNRELEKRYGIGAHTLSFPRLEPAENTPFASSSHYRVSNDDFVKLITVLRLAVPYTGMILTARETPQLRRELLNLGITQTDASTRIGIGSYNNSSPQQESEKQQFLLGDTRSLDEVIREFAKLGFITSFCTAGYRCGRTGKCIMDLLRTGAEGKFCKLNAVITFREWIDDFASEQTRRTAEPLIQQEIEEIRTSMPQTFSEFMTYYNRTKNGERDLYF